MPLPHSDGCLEVTALTSRLSRSLLRLNRKIEQARQDEARVEGLFRSWQDMWAGNRQQLSRRLELIEAQLRQLTSEPEPAPRFNVVAFPGDGDELGAI